MKMMRIVAIGSPNEAVFVTVSCGDSHAGKLTLVGDEWGKFSAALVAGASATGLTLEVVEDFDDEPTVPENADGHDDCADCVYGTGTECALTHCPYLPDNT
jgi:hypothetical protein